MGKLLVIFCAYLMLNIAMAPLAKAGIAKLALKPITIPLSIVRYALGTGFKLATKAPKAALRNISVSSGPVKIRPFDFQS